MAIHDWWAGDAAERFWMEITNRSDIGANLHAPKEDDAGREYWSYALVSHVMPGDVVFHWDKNAGPGITSFSVVTGSPRSSRIVWQSRGSYGRTHDASGSEPAWKAPLGGLVSLPSPLTQERLRADESAVRTVRDNLDSAQSAPTYFPFAISDKRPVRAAQGYLVKFPRGLVAAFPELAPALDLSRGQPGDDQAGSTTATSSAGNANTGRLTDAKRKKMIEMYAVNTVMSIWAADGWKVTDVGLKGPWDVTAIRGAKEVHVEVKGSTGTRDAVDLTDGEVRHAEANPQTVLVVVDQIKCDSTNHCTEGRVRTWDDWVPDRGTLVPTSYRYPLPADPV